MSHLVESLHLNGNFICTILLIRFFLSCEQMLLRRKYLHKNRFARRIQRFTRRSKIIFAWQDTVYSVLEIAHDAATIVQCWLRRAAAQRFLRRLKDAYERAHFVYGHDFTVSEEANWAAFGLTISGADDHYCEELCRRPVVQLSTQHWNNTTRLASSSNKAHEEKLSQATRPPAAGEVLRLIEYPPLPPGCLPPPTDTHEHGTDHFSVFTMLDLADHTGATKSELGGNGAPSGTAECMVDIHKHFPDSFMVQLAVRRFISDSSTHQHSHVSSGDIISTEATLPDHNGPLEEAVLRKWRQEHLGDILDGSSADLSTLFNGADFCEENVRNNVCNDQQRKSANHTSPIYALLARKFL